MLSFEIVWTILSPLFIFLAFGMGITWGQINGKNAE